MTEKRLADLFEEWKRRFDKNPAEFMSQYDMEKEQPKTYGQACAAYFKKLEKEVR